MLNENVRNSILKTLRTRSHANAFLGYLDEKRSGLYKRGTSAATATVYDNLLNSAVGEGESDLNALITDVTNFLAHVEGIHIKTALDLDDQFVTAIYNYFLEITKEPFLLEMSIEKSIVGGLEVVYKGKYYDLSLSSRVNTYFEQHKDGINEILHS